MLQKVMDGHTLTRLEASAALKRLTSGELAPEVIAAFLGAIRARRETAEELVGFVEAARELAVPVPGVPDGLIDVCGTGGDGSGTFNISTTVSFVLAGAGVGVAKHGNRSVSSKSGSADVLEKLGVRTDLGPAAVLKSIQDANFGFFFAPRYHPAFKAVAAVRKAMAVRTVFNLLGPLVNPARVRFQVIGVYDAQRLMQMAQALRELGTQQAMIFCSEDGLDELSLSSATHVVHLRDGVIDSYDVMPEDAGFKRSAVSELAGGDADENAGILRRILSGEEKGPKRDIVLLNSAAALVVSGRAKDLREGARIAAEAIDAGKATECLRKAGEAKE